MNKLRYRIVFNKTRGMCMVVAENTRSQGKGPGEGLADGPVPSAMRFPALRRMAFLLGMGLGGVVLAGGALAQIVAHPDAPGQQRPTVLNAANGVLQVDIQTPSGAGVSRNVYSQFDVPKSGAVLNNSRTNVRSELGGWVQANPWLSTGTARVILNEVVSSNPSRLQGYIEVAGARAETIIANPAGIVVDGGGFINVSRATLTTGTPVLENGRVKGYSVQRGQIVIDGAGLDASKTDYTALIARSLQVNAGLWAQRLNVIAGANEVEEAEQAGVTAVNPSPDAAPLYAIDVARLGGMYANQIYLVGTEAGVGVRSAGAIGAAAGELVVTANGRLENRGTLSASADVHINAPAVENHGSVQAAGALGLSTDSLTNTGQIRSGSEAHIAARVALDNTDGSIEAPRLDLQADSMLNARGRIVQTGVQALIVTAGQLVNDAGTLGQGAAPPAAPGTATGNADAGAGAGSSAATGSGASTTGPATGAGTPAAGQSGTGTPSAPATVLADGQLNARVIDNTSGLITGNGNLDVHAGSFASRGGHAYLNRLSVDGPSFDNSGGALTVLRAFDAHTGQFVNDQGKLLVGATFNGTLGSFSNRQGLLQAQQLSVDVAGQLDNSGGTLRHLGAGAAALAVDTGLALEQGTLDIASDLNLRAGAISGSGGVLNVSGNLALDSGTTSSAQGSWKIGGSASLRTGAFDNTGGRISVAQALDLTSGALTNSGGMIAGGAGVSIGAAGSVDNAGGAIQAGRDLALSASGTVRNHAGSIGTLAASSTLNVGAAAIDNGDGRIANAGTGNTVLAADDIVSRGLIGGNGTVTITAHTLRNEIGGSIAAQGDLALAVDTTLANAGRIDAGGNIRMAQATARLSNSGSIGAQGAIGIAVAAVDNAGGTIATVAGSGSAVTLSTASLGNRAGSIQADGTLALTIKDSVDNDGGHVRAGADLSLDAGGQLANRTGSIESAAGMRVHAAGIGNDGGVIAAAATGTTVIEADGAIDNNGLIGANGQLTLKAQTLSSGTRGSISAGTDLELAVTRALDNAGAIGATGMLHLDQAHTAFANSGTITAGAGAYLNLDRIDNRGGTIGTLQGANLDMHANSLDNRGGRLLAGGDALVNVKGDADNGGGVLQAASSLDAQADGILHNAGGVIESLGARGTLALHAGALSNDTGRIVNAGSGATVVHALTTLANNGQIAGNGTLDLQAGILVNTQDGKLASGAAMTITAGERFENAGTVNSGASLDLAARSAAVANSGRIVANGALGIASVGFDNDGGQLATAAGSGADLVLDAAGISNRGGSILSDRNARVNSAGIVDNTGGTLQAAGSLRLDAAGAAGNDGGLIETLAPDATLSMHVGRLDNGNGRIVNVGTGATAVNVDGALASRGTLAVNGSLDLVVGALDNQAGGSIAAAHTLHIGAAQGIANAGAIDARGTLTLDAAGPVANGGSIAGGADVALHAGDLSNVDGTVSAGATLDVRAGAIDNTGGRLVNVGSGATRVTADGSIVNGGVLAGNGSVDLTAASVDNRAGGTIAAGAALDLHVTRQLDNAGTISAGTTLNMDEAAARIANSGAIVAAGELTLHGAAIANVGGRIDTLAGAGMVLRSESTLSNRAGIIAATGDAALDAHGAFDNTQGRVQTQGQLGVRADGALTNAGGVIEAVGAASALALQAGPIDNTAGRIVNAGNGRVDIDSTGAIVNSGTIGGNGALAISAQQLHNTSEGVISASSTVDLALQGQLDNAGTLRSGASLHADLAGGTFTNTGVTTAGGDVGIAAGSVDNSGGTVSADGLLRVAAADGVANAGGTLHGGTGAALVAGGALANGSGTIEAAAGTLDVAAQSIGSSGRIVNAGTGATTVASASSIVNDGAIAGNGALTLSAQTLQNTGFGSIGSGAGLELAVSRQMSNAGTVSSAGTLYFSQPATSFSNRGNIGAGGAIDITAAALSNAGGQLFTANGSGAAINLRSDSLDNTGGTVSADGVLQADVIGATANNGGTLHGGSGIMLHAGGALANGSGTIETVGGTLDVAAQSIDSAGRIVNAGTGATTVAAASSIANRGTIAGNGTLTLAAQTLQNAGGGAIGSGAGMELAVRQQLDNAGSIGSGGSVHVDQAGASFSNSGQIGAVSGIDITAATIANAGGQLYTLNGSGTAIGLHTAGGLDNAGGTISADGTLLVQAGGNVGNDSGLMHAGTGLTLDAGGALNNGSGTIENAAGTFTLDAASLANGGRIVNAGTGNTRVDVTSGIVNSGTIAGKGALALAAQTLQNTAAGAIGSGAALELAVRQQLANAGTISSGSSLDVVQAAANVVNSGRIGAAGNIDVSANTIDNTGGTVTAGGQLALAAAGTIANDAGTLQGAAGATVNAGGTLANGSGTIQALAGTLQVQAQAIGNGGSIVNGGTGATTISSTAAIVNSGTIGGNGTLDLHAAALQNGGGRILSGRALLLDMRQSLTNAGTINSGGTLTFNQAGASFANSGQIAAAGDIHITAAALDNNGGRISTVRGSGSDVTLAASSLSNRVGAIMADRDATLSIGGAVDDTQGLLQAGRNLTLAAAGNVGNNGGVIETLGSASSLSVTAAGIDNGGGRIVNAGSGATRLVSLANIDNGGTIAGMGNVLLSGQSVSNASGATIASGNGLTLAVSRQFVNRGKVNSAGTLTFDQAGATFTNSGEIYAGGDVVIHASTMNNDGGNLGTGSGSGASLALSSWQMSNLNGHIVTAADLVVNTGTFTGFGELFGGRDLTLSMNGDFVQNGAQQIHANRNFSLSVTGSIVNGSTLAAAGTLALSGQNIANQAGASIEGRSVVLNAAGNLTNAGEINGQDTLDIRAAAVGNTGGIVGGNVALATDNLGNTGPAALVGATESLALGVAGTLNNTGGATLYSSGDMVIGGRNGGSAGAVNNVSSTIEAAGDLTLNTNSLSNVRENVQIVQVQTVDETRHMSLPSWDHNGDNHNAFETSAANYNPHEVYFVNPSDVLDDQVWVTPDGYTVHRAVIRTHANDSAFYVAGSGLYSAYGQQTRLIASEGTRVIYYTQADYVANPDQGGAASNAIVYADSVTHWNSTVSFSNQYGTCSSGCIRLITQPDYNDPGTTILRDTVRALAPVKSQLEFSRDAHHVAVEDQVAPGAGAAAQILSGGNMHLTVGSTLENRYGDIKARGGLWIDGSAAINNVGATLYRTHTFDGTWTTYDGQTVAYQQPSISEAIGSAAGVIQGGQGVSISGRSFSNVDVTAGTVGNIRAAVHVIGSGVVGAGSAGASVATANVGAGPAGVQATAGTGVSRIANTTVSSGDGAGAVSGVHAAAGHGNDGAASGQVAGSAMAPGPSLGGAFTSTGNGRDPGAATHATASGVTNGLHVDGSAYAGGSADGLGTSGAVGGSKIAAVRNTTRAGNVLTAATTAVSQQAGSVQGLGLGSVTKVSPGGLFLRNPDANGSYLFETRPQFANRQQWTSSDYLLKQLEVDPSSTQKRLGDGFYEQRLVREQLAELTGHAPETGASDDSTYKQLLTNAVSAAREFGLRPGVTLSAEQVSHLTSDIVWMESQTVMLPDGSTETVLVPKVYLAHLGSHAVTPGGALVTGNGVQIDTTESIANKGGVIDGGNGRTLLVAARDIVNQGGTIKGGSVALAAGGDVRNESLTVKQSYDFGQNSGSHTSLSNTATISATGALDIMAGRDLSDLGGRIGAGSATLSAGRNIDFNTIQTGSTYQSNIAGYTEKDSSVTHQLSQISTGGDLKMAAMGNLSLTGTQVSIGTNGQGAGLLLAGGNVNIGAVVNEVNTSVQNDPGSKAYDKQVHANQTVVGTGVKAAGDLTVGAGIAGSGALNVTGSSLTAGGALALSAADSVNIVSTQEAHLSDTAITRSSSSVFKSKTTQQADYVASSQAIGSSVSGKTVDINAGKDINVLGSAIAGDANVSLAAAGSVNIAASTSTLTESHHSQVKESGFLSGGGFGISYGTRTTTTDQQRDATTQSGQSRSVVGSLAGNLDIVAGNAVKVSGSDLAAGLNMTLDGRSVTIDPGQDNSKGKYEQKTVQDGLTFAVGGSVVNAIQTYQSMHSAASQSKDTRVQALAAATAAMAASSAAKDVAQNGPSISLSLTAGHSESQYTQTTSNLLNSGSVLNAGKDLTIRASGGGQDSNVNVIGSQLNAQGNVTLLADNQVNLLAAQNLESQHSDTRSMSAAAGISAAVGTKGISAGLTASASVGRGNEDGDGTTQMNTHVTAGKDFAIHSGGDTNLKGAVASGTRVVADVGGNLDIESLQDTARFDSKNQSASGTVGVGASVGGGVNVAKLSSDYASVQEQSGIRAGADGFQINVKGNTNLKGGVISSAQQAIDARRNVLTTGTLTVADVANHADYSGQSVGLSGSYGAGTKQPQAPDTTGVASGIWKPMQAGGSGVNAPVAMSASDSKSSVTNSGISGATINITDETKQIALTGKTAVEALAGVRRDVTNATDTSGALKPNFDRSQIQAAFAVTSGFGQQVGILLQTHAQDADDLLTRAKELENRAIADENLPDTERFALLTQANELRTDAADLADKWGPGGNYRQIATALSAAASGNVAGSASQLGQNLVVNYVQQQGAAFVGSLVAKGDLTEGSPLHAALQGLVACAGAAASNQQCSAGAAGAAASSLLTGLFAEPSPDESKTDVENKRNLLATLVAGIAASSGIEASTAVNGAIAATDNNWLATQQAARLKKELAAAKGTLDTLKVLGKWYAVDKKQDVLTLTGVGKGLAESAWSDVKGIAEFMQHPLESLQGLRAIVNDPAVVSKLGAEVVKSINAKIGAIQTELTVGGDQNAELLGKNIGDVIWQVASIASGVGDVAKAGVTLAKAGVKVGKETVEALKNSAKLADVSANVANVAANAKAINKVKDADALASKISNGVVPSKNGAGSGTRLTDDSGTLLQGKAASPAKESIKAGSGENTAALESQLGDVGVGEHAEDGLKRSTKTTELSADGSTGKTAYTDTGAKNTAPNIVYRALTPADAASIEAGTGLTAKAPNGTWTATEHVANTGPGAGGAAANSPWISTTRLLDVAKGYEGGNGIVAIDLSKVGSFQTEVWQTAPRVNGVAGLPYHRSIWAQEVTIFQEIPQNAIVKVPGTR